MIFKVRYFPAGGHVHCSLFAASRPNTTFAKCGDFVVRLAEFDPLKNAMAGVLFEKGAPRGMVRDELYGGGQA